MSVLETSRRVEPDVEVDLEVLESVQRRVLWLATSIVHHANNVRATASGVKVGGHQASSASSVSIMTALYFAHLQGPDRVSVKPHASPVLHAIEYLLGELDERYLTTLREFGGLQSYPSRLKDPVPADFSTGSVGIGATAPIWSALAHRYVAGHFEVSQGGRQVALVGDAELDEGACWEAILDPVVSRLGEVLWIVDVNRQSLDRIVPDIAADRLRRMFEAAGWHAQTVKYGRRLEAVFDHAGGSALRRRIDQMTNEEYQRLLRLPSADVRERLPGAGRGQRDIERALNELDDESLIAALRDLGGHDLTRVLDSLREADAVTDRPSVIFAYTIKAWGLPTLGHPANHSALLTDAEWEHTGIELGARPDHPWARFAPDSPEAELCHKAAERLARERPTPGRPPEIPHDVGRAHGGRASTQQAFGRFFADLAHSAPEVSAHIVTVSPDVASSTNLGGWINRVGIWHPGDRIDWFADDTNTLVRWRESQHGQHIELGIAEGNLVGLLAASWAQRGRATAFPCYPWEPCMTRSSIARSSRGRSPCTRAGSRSSSAPRPESRWLPRAEPTSRSSRRQWASNSPGAWPGSRPSARISSGRCSTPCRAWGSPTAARRTSGCRRGRWTSLWHRSPRIRRRSSAGVPTSSPAVTYCGAPRGARRSPSSSWALRYRRRCERGKTFRTAAIPSTWSA